MKHDPEQKTCSNEIKWCRHWAHPDVTHDWSKPFQNTERGKKYKPPIKRFGRINPKRKLNEAKNAMIDMVCNDLSLYTNHLSNDKHLDNVLPPSVQHFSERKRDKSSYEFITNGKVKVWRLKLFSNPRLIRQIVILAKI